jgi:ferredoxin
MTAPAATGKDPQALFDLLTVPVLGPLLRKRGTRTVARTLVLVVGAVMILHGLVGPDLAPKNLATLLTWVHYRGVLVLVLLAAGNFFCTVCPFVLARDLARKVVRPRLNWPRALRNKWPAILALVGVLFSYELFSLWGSPWWTAWLLIGYFATAIVIDCVFKHASFCKYVCPIGQFNFVASLVAPLEVKVRRQSTCDSCRTKDCIRGRRDETESPFRILQRGCELALFQPQKAGNMDCTFCLDCVYACPHDNIGISARVPGNDLVDPVRRSGVGKLADRWDIAALGTVFTFGALLNAFGMVSPVYALQAWLSGILHTTDRAPILGLLFAFGLLVEPAVLLGSAAWISRRLVGSREKLLPRIARYAYCLVPLGFGVWLAHYSFHFLTGALTVVPVVQEALLDLGWQVGGDPAWGLGGLPPGAVFPLEIGFLSLGLLGSLTTAFRIAEQDDAKTAWRAALPWAMVCLLLFASGIWLLSQPMDMRGTFLGSN